MDGVNSRNIYEARKSLKSSLLGRGGGGEINAIIENELVGLCGG